MKRILFLAAFVWSVAACSPNLSPITQATAPPPPLAVSAAPLPTQSPSSNATLAPPTATQPTAPAATSTLTPAPPTLTTSPSPTLIPPTPTLLPTLTATTPPLPTRSPTAAGQALAASTSPSNADEPSDDSDQPAPGLLALVLAHAGSVKRDVTYCTVDGVALKLDLFSPKNRNGVTPLVVFVHGGFLIKGDKRARGGMTDFPALLDAGMTVATLNYRLAPQYKFPAMIDDTKCAIRFLRAHANEYQIDPNRIGVWGTSAGGYLVNLLGTTDAGAGFDVGEYLDQSSRVQAVADLFGPADLTVAVSPQSGTTRETVFPGYDMAKASPVTYVSADDPPFLIMQGDADRIVPLAQAQEFYQALVGAGVPAQLVVVHNGPHGLMSPRQSISRAELTKMIVQFFQSHLK